MPKQPRQDLNMALTRPDKLMLAGSVALSLIAWAISLWICRADWWRVLLEHSPLAWLHFSLLGTISVLSVLNGFTLRKKDNRSDWVWWLVLGLGFFYLAWDERLALHEFTRNEILAPRQFHIPFLPWIKTGDYLLFLIMLGALILLPKILALFKSKRIAWRFFLAGAIVSALTILFDSFNTDSWSAYYNGLWQLLDEIMETVSMLLLVNAVFMMYTHTRSVLALSPPSVTRTGPP